MGGEGAGAVMQRFPLDVWGIVRSTPRSGAVERVKIVPLAGGAFLILTAERGSEFDRWAETIEEVEGFLEELEIEWPSPGGE